MSTKPEQSASECPINGCPMTTPHGHCGASCCIVPVEDDGKYCEPCAEQYERWAQAQEWGYRGRSEE